MEHAQLEVDEQFQQCKEAIGVGSEGRVPNEYYEDAKECERKLKADALDAAETDEERQHLIDNWLFDDFSEGELPHICEERKRDSSPPGLYEPENILPMIFWMRSSHPDEAPASAVGLYL